MSSDMISVHDLKNRYRIDLIKTDIDPPLVFFVLL